MAKVSNASDSVIFANMTAKRDANLFLTAPGGPLISTLFPCSHLKRTFSHVLHFNITKIWVRIHVEVRLFQLR
jgi:hypothetical protein